MNSEFVEHVSPLDMGKETVYVFMTIALVLVIAAIAISLRVKTDEKAGLLPYQISAFEDLSPDELAIYQDLYAAALEIDGIHDENEGTWLGIEDLENDYIAPFVKDLSWKVRGEIQWQHFSPDLPNQHTAIYIGKPLSSEKLGTFLLVMIHRHDETSETAPSGHDGEEHMDIWYDVSNTLSFDGKMKEDYLVAQGWKEIIPYSGEEELNRLNRGQR